MKAGFKRFGSIALAAAMAATSGVAVSQGPPGGGRPGDGRPGGPPNGRPGGGPPSSGRPGGPPNGGRPGGPPNGRPGGPGYGGRPGRPGPPPNFRFGNNGGMFAQHYRSDAMRWRGRRNRPRFYRGMAIPRGYVIQQVPPGYWQGGPPPPPGYQYGYYDGYVVAYDPTTRIVADVLDIAASLVR